ncbi:MFS transporter [Amycolatopsis sp. 195334CR]|uniref:MFS transporter n=1 Tax=Amycolatopsis sp. 195334CR TaxID=2814588 RepID=UPI001A8FE9DB|nr:MFS transporter [Amycolatopsis sp. 195334CR]MBN6038701.1 MFS transporter [Amycolatopsis sp. 195334CR]
MRSLAGLLSATALSFTGNSIVSVAVPWVVHARTGSATLAGLAAAAAIAPVALSAVFGGALIDRLGRRSCSIGADVCSALAVAALPLLDATAGLGIGLILVLVALGAVFDGPGSAAREALRPDVARHSGIPLSKVNAWGEAAEGAGALAGPGLGGVLLVTLGGFGTLWVAAAMFALAVVATVLTLPRHLSPPPPAEPEPYLRSVVAGLRFVVREPALRAVVLTGTIIVLFLAPFQSVVLTVHLRQTGEATGYGTVLAAFAAGGIAGAIGYGLLGDRLPPRAGLVAAVGVTGVLLTAFAALPPVGVLVALALVAGVVSGPVNPIAALIMQARTPEHLRGRVIGSSASLALAAGPLGLLVFGPLVDFGGPGLGYLVIGAGCLLAALYAATAPGLRTIPSDDKQGAPP